MKLIEKFKTHYVNEEKENKSSEIIKELMSTGFSGDNENQMKAVQLLKGLATSDEEEANAFMAKLDKALKGINENLQIDEEEKKQLPTWEVTFSNRKDSVRVKAKNTSDAYVKAGKRLGMEKNDALAFGKSVKKID